jgi:RNA polymerase sigma-70 factor (ECF subfamily)
MNSKAFEAVFVSVIRENEKIIYKVCSFYTSNNDDLKDLFQEIVLQAWKAYPKFKNGCKVSTWLYKIALNTSISQYRKEKNKPTHQTIGNLNFDLPDDFGLENEENMKLLYEMVSQLNDFEKALILLYLEDKKYDEIADITGLSVTNVATKLSRVKEKLKTKATQLV